MREGISNMRIGVGDTGQYFVTEENIKKFIALPPHNVWLKGFIDMIDFLSSYSVEMMVEIGGWQGESATLFAYHFPKAKIYSVEPFIPNYDPELHVARQNMEIVEGNYRERIEKFPNIELLRMTSVQALQNFSDGSLDFVYIDGDHRYEFVQKDIGGWMKKVCSGGFIGGHDQGMPGISKAIEEKLGKVDHSFVDGSWLKRL